jgi:hypothetical protein
LAARQSVAKLVQRNNQKQRQILGDIPRNGGISAGAILDFIGRPETTTSEETRQFSKNEIAVSSLDAS